MTALDDKLKEEGWIKFIMYIPSPTKLASLDLIESNKIPYMIKVDPDVINGLHSIYIPTKKLSDAQKLFHKSNWTGD